MNIPNVITLSRILLTPIFVSFYLRGQQGTAMLLLALAAASDMLDGFIARSFNMVTPLGKVLDPVADKLLQLAMLLCLVERSSAVLPLLLLHVLRESGLFVMGALVYRRTGLLIGASWYGKACTALMYGVLGLALLWPAMPREMLGRALMLCAGAVVYCMARYGVEYIRLLRSDEKKIA